MPESTRSSRETTDPHLWITILAGGVGSRFWPASTPARPKQLLPLATEQALIVDTVERARALAPDARIRVLAAARLCESLQRAVPSLPAECFWSEPTARGTATALTWAAHRIRRMDPEAVMVSLHSDHVIRPTEAFQRLLAEAARLARSERLLLTVGAPPERADVGFGYIQLGEPIASAPDFRAFRVARFHEKPDAHTAQDYLSRGFLWNTGLFVWRADAFLREVERHTAELAGLLPLLDEENAVDFFARAPVMTVDVAVLERSDRVGVLRANFQWDDVGSWEALARTLPTDARGNVAQGDAHLVEASGNIVFSDDAPVVLFGVDDLVVVRTARATLVTSRALAPELKKLVEQLPERLRDLD